MPEKQSVEAMSQFLKALSDPTRLEIIRRIQGKEHCVCEFVEMFDISQPAISRHLKVLKTAEVILERRDRQWIYYRLNEAHPQYEIVLHILKELEAEPALHPACGC